MERCGETETESEAKLQPGIGWCAMSSTLFDRALLDRPQSVEAPTAASNGNGSGAKKPAPAPAGGIEYAALVALTAVTLAAAYGFCRVFAGWSFFGPLALAAVGSHATAFAARRLRWPLIVGVLANVAAGALVLGHALYGKTMRYGLPSGTTWHVFYTEVRDATKGFGTAVPPVPATGGFIAAAAVAVWIAALVADTFAFRLRAIVESIIPSSVLYIFVAAVSAKRLRLTTATVFVLAALAAIALLRTMRTAAGGGWLTGHRRGASIALARIGIVIAVVAAVGGAMVGPRLPGAKSKALVDTKNTGNDTKFVISPLVEIKKRLSNRSSVELFSVVATGPRTYWRVTSLPDFNGEQWASDLKQGKAKDKLSDPPASLATAKATATFKIAALGSIWMPAPFLPTGISAISAKKAPKFDKESATLMLPGDLQRGDSYTVTAAVPNVDADAVRAASLRPVKVDKRYLALPGNFPRGMRTLAADITKDADTPYDKALAMQAYFQGFNYSLDGASGQGVNDMQEFLDSRSGYCEQFSGTFAAFARSLGIPARVAVGFTPGELQGDRYSVQARHAHAWPELYFDGLGWLPFEPTPGRGNPAATSYTGVPESQDGQAPPPVATTLVPPTTSVTLPSDTRVTTPSRTEPTLPDGAPVPKKPSKVGRNLLIIGGIASLIIGYPLLVRLLKRRRWDRRRNRAADGRDRVLVAWHQTADALTEAGYPPRPHETPSEYAKRSADELPIGREQMNALAGHVTTALYGVHEPADEAVVECETVPKRVGSALETITGRRAKIDRFVNPLPLLRPLPGDRVRTRRGWDLS
jgi:transglutaminase-like putative cysteine protease